jgi:hypothetical protein
MCQKVVCQWSQCVQLINKWDFDDWHERIIASRLLATGKDFLAGMILGSIIIKSEVDRYYLDENDDVCERFDGLLNLDSADSLWFLLRLRGLLFVVALHCIPSFPSR